MSPIDLQLMSLIFVDSASDPSTTAPQYGPFKGTLVGEGRMVPIGTRG